FQERPALIRKQGLWRAHAAARPAGKDHRRYHSSHSAQQLRVLPSKARSGGSPLPARRILAALPASYCHSPVPTSLSRNSSSLSFGTIFLGRAVVCGARRNHCPSSNPVIQSGVREAMNPSSIHPHAELTCQPDRSAAPFAASLNSSSRPKRPDFFFRAAFWRVGPRSGGIMACSQPILAPWGLILK